MSISQLTRAAGLAAVVLAVMTLAITLYAVNVAYSPLPYWDQWERVTPGQHLSDMFVQHNEHLLVIPSLFFLIDTAVFGGRNVFLLASILLIQGIHAGLLIWLARRAGARGSGLLLAGGLTVALLFSGAQIENLYWGFQVQFVIVYLLATACFTVTVLARPGWKADAAAAALGLAAAFSFSAGLLVLPAAAVGALLAGRGWRRIGVLAVSAAVAAFIYSRGMQTFNHSNPGDALGHVIEIVYYTIVYLGAPFGYALSESPLAGYAPAFQDPIEGAKLFGAAGLAASLLLVPLTLWRSGPIARLVLLLVAGLVVGAGLLTAMGRWELGAQQAFASRYATPVLIFWVAIAALVWSFARSLPRQSWRAGAMLALGGVQLLAMLLLLSNRDIWMDMAHSQRNRTVAAESAILTGALDREALAGIYPSPELVLERSQLLARERLSVFGREEAGWLNRPLAEFVSEADAGACIGAVDVRFALETSGAAPGSFRLAGWGWNSSRRESPRAYLVVDSDGIVRGYGRRAIDRPDVTAALPVVDDLRTGWIANVRAEPQEPLIVYALVGSGRSRMVCQIGSI
ncbi:MAG: hypothetical protein ACXIVL_06575 [Oceanicaulis sp.]